jgi:hypothetical protein
MRFLAIWMLTLVVSAAPPDVRSIVLPPGALGSEWVVIDNTGDAQYERVQYFNSAVEHARFRMAVITVTTYSTREEADAATELARSVLEGYRYAVAPEPGLGSGAAYRASQVDQRGLLVVLRLFREGQLGITVAVTAMAGDQRTEDVEAEASRIAILQARRAEGVLLEETQLPPLRTPASSTVLDPTPLVLSAESLGGTWGRDGDYDRGGSAEQLRTHTRLFRNDNQESPAQKALIAVTLARDEPTAQMTLALFVADWEANGHAVRSSALAGDGATTFEATQTWPDGSSEAAYLYQIGPVVVQASVAGERADPFDLLPIAREASLAESARIADLLPTLWYVVS